MIKSGLGFREKAVIIIKARRDAKSIKKGTEKLEEKDNADALITSVVDSFTQKEIKDFVNRRDKLLCTSLKVVRFLCKDNRNTKVRVSRLSSAMSRLTADIKILKDSNMCNQNENIKKIEALKESERYHEKQAEHLKLYYQKRAAGYDEKIMQALAERNDLILILANEQIRLLEEAKTRISYLQSRMSLRIFYYFHLILRKCVRNGVSYTGFVINGGGGIEKIEAKLSELSLLGEYEDLLSKSETHNAKVVDDLKQSYNRMEEWTQKISNDYKATQTFQEESTPQE